MSSLLDFNLVNDRVIHYKSDYNLETSGEAFQYLVLENLLELGDNEIDDCIVDGSQDRGIDAIYINDSEDQDIEIHILQFKYTTEPNKTKNNFPGNEIDKFTTIVRDILNNDDDDLKNEVNPLLWEKIKEIREILSKKSMPKFYFYLCSNMQEPNVLDKKRFERYFNNYSNFSFEYIGIDKLVSHILKKPHLKINGQIKFIGKQYFEKSSATIKALIGVVSALDLIEFLLEDKNKKGEIQEAIFENNIRIYQSRKKNAINESIYETALDEELKHDFVFLNNGITMTCDKFEYMDRQNPIVNLENVQIVNGSQTSHSIFEAYNTLDDNNKTKIDDVLILVRIYETKKDIVSKIVQTTNSQTIISSRDLRANDPIQRKLHAALLDKGYFYEAKKNYYMKESKSNRLDSLLIGQILMAYNNNKPHEVKYNRREVFGKYYNDVFDAEIINADLILKLVTIFNFIEKRKKEYQKKLRKKEATDQKYLFIPHASFYILYAFKLIIEKNNIQVELNNPENLKNYYADIIEILAALVSKAEEKQGKKYTHNAFFRNKGSVNDLEEQIASLLDKE